MDCVEEIAKKTYDKETKLVRDIFEMFCIYYGEDNVELKTMDLGSIVDNIKERIKDELTEEELSQEIRYVLSCYKPEIYIHWPSITIENERGNKIDIYDLFCRLIIDTSGKLNNIGFARSTFTNTQFDFGYLHSHLRPIPVYEERHISNEKCKSITNAYKNFNSFCFGRGPIVQTLNSLMPGRLGEDEIIAKYMLFCRELDISVRIESLEGVPYIKMQSLKYGKIKYEYKETEGTEILGPEKDFVKYLFENIDLKYVFDGSNYMPACSFEDFSIYATKTFIKYMKSRNGKDIDASNGIGFVKEMLQYVKKDNGSIIFDDETYASKNEALKKWINEDNVEIACFKGRKYYMKILKPEIDTTAPRMALLKDKLVSYIWDLLIVMLNSNMVRNDSGNKTKHDKPDDERAEVRYGFYV